MRSVVFRLLTTLLLLLAASLALIELRPIGNGDPPPPEGGRTCRENDAWCKRLAALKSADGREALRDLNKLVHMLPDMRPTGDVYAMRVGDHLRRPETGPLVDREDFGTARRQFVTAVLTYDLPARLTRLRRIEEQASDPTIRHRALLEIAASIIRADDRARYAEAHAALDQALRLPIPTKAANSDVHFLLARLERKANRPREALDALNQAIELDGYFYHAHLDRLRLILSLENAVAAQQREMVIDAALQTGDVITVLEDRSYLIELQQVLARHGQHRSLIRPFIEAYVGAARRDHQTLAAAIRAFGEACHAVGQACPRLLQSRIDDLRTLQSRG